MVKTIIIEIITIKRSDGFENGLIVALFRKRLLPIRRQISALSYPCISARLAAYLTGDRTFSEYPYYDAHMHIHIYSTTYTNKISSRA